MIKLTRVLSQAQGREVSAERFVVFANGSGPLRFDMSPADAKTELATAPVRCVYFRKALISSAITMETGKAPHVARETGVKICFHDLI